MLSKKSLLAVVLLFSSLSVRAVSYVLEYNDKTFSITQAALNQSKRLKDFVEEFGGVEKADDKETYEKLHDEEGNFKISLNSILADGKLPDGKKFLDILNEADVKRFIGLSNGTVNTENLNGVQLIVQLNLANFLDNKTLLKDVSTALIKEIKNEKSLKKFLEAKGLLWAFVTIFSKLLPRDVLEHWLKQKLVAYLKKFWPMVERDADSVTSYFPGLLLPVDKMVGTRVSDGSFAIGKKKFTRDGDGQFVAAAWSLNGKKLASSSFDKTIAIWDPESSELLKVIHSIENNFTLAWSWNGKKLASGSYDGTIRIWDPKSDKLLQTFEGGLGHRVTVIAWSWDGKKLAFGLDDNTVRIWNVKNGTSKILTGQRSSATLIAWSQDGERLASESDNGIIRIWNVETGKLSKTFEMGTPTYFSMAWSLDGDFLAYTPKNFHSNTILILDLHFFDDVSFKQAALMLALQERYDKQKTPFNITANKKMFKILSNMPVDKVRSMRGAGWISISDDQLNKIKRQPSREEKRRRFLRSVQLRKLLNGQFSDLVKAEQPFDRQQLSLVDRKVKSWKKHIKIENFQEMFSKLEFKIFQAIIAHKIAWRVKGYIAQIKKTADQNKILYAKKLIKEIRRLRCQAMAAELDKELGSLEKREDKPKKEAKK